VIADAAIQPEPSVQSDHGFQFAFQFRETAEIIHIKTGGQVLMANNNLQDRGSGQQLH
jgi:hypothetical protein